MRSTGGDIHERRAPHGGATDVNERSIRGYGCRAHENTVEHLYRRAAAYADKIFKGAKPGDLPIEQPMRFEFVLNKKTARALGLKITNSILVQVTKIIE